MSLRLPPSPLSDDPAVWEGLARRIADDAAQPLASYAEEASAADGHRFGGWLGALAARAPWLVGASAAATVLLWLALPPRPGGPDLPWIESSLTSIDPAAGLVGGALPPTVEALMIEFPPAFGGDPRETPEIAEPSVPGLADPPEGDPR